MLTIAISMFLPFFVLVAMATNEMLQEHVTCPVCLDVFDDPHSLECRHIVCLSCLNQLKKRGRLQCPECREVMPFKKIKRDLKMAKLVENFKKEKEAESKEGIPDRQPKGCEVCKLPRKAAVCWCKTCDTYLCQSCELAHKGVRATKNHVLESQAEIILAVQNKAKIILENSKQDLAKVEQSLSDISASMALINDKKSTQQAKINVCIDRLIHQLENRRAKLKHELIKGNDKTLETLKQNMKVFENHKTLLQESIICLIELSSTKVLETLMGPTSTCNLSEQSIKIENDIRQLECNIQDSPVKVINGPDCNVESYIKVHNSNVSYADLLKVKCGQQEHVCDDEDEPIFNLCKINDELWCCKGETIRIKTSFIERTITHYQIKKPCGLTKGPNDDVFVACSHSYGLHQLKSKGKYKDKEEYVCEILKGSFSDVCYYNHHLYALNYEQKKVYVLGKGDSQWYQKIELEVGDPISMNYCTTMSVNRHGIFISSPINKRLYQLSHKGDLMQTAGMSPEEDQALGDEDVDDDDYQENDVGILYYPFLCGVDSDGIALVGDFYNSVFQLYNCKDNTWQVIILKDVECPISAVLDGNDLFISTRQKELLYYRVE